MFDIARQRATERERLRIADLMTLTPRGQRVLEIGARDCYLSGRLIDLYEEVTALDLTLPRTTCERVVPIRGDVTALRFADDSFDTVFCTEVLEHIQPALLQQACDEIARVSRRYAVIGVPFRQDLRAGRMRCDQCGKVNPTTGHLSTFDYGKLEALFTKTMRVKEVRLVGDGAAAANRLSTTLFAACGYPYGTYGQEEGCVHCGEKMSRPRINPAQWGVCFVARGLVFTQSRLRKILGIRHPLWIHILFEKIPEPGCD